jgi:rod shape-determining protein MreD
MKGARGVAIAALTIFVAAILQQSLGFRASFFGARPDFMLVALSVLGIGSNRAGGILLGFSDGLVMGGLAGANLQHYVTSRTICGLLLGWSSKMELPHTLFASAVITGAVTVIAQLIFMFLAPSHSIGAFLADTIRSAVYNGVLAIPVFALLKRFMAPAGR